MTNETLEARNTLSAGLDYYKPTMSQVHFEQHPDAEVTFTFKNRGDQRLADYIDPVELQDRFEELRAKNWTPAELRYFAGLKDKEDKPMFTGEFIDYLATNQLPEIQVALDGETDDLAITTVGDAPLVTFWETIVMSEINEAYFEAYLAEHNLDPMAIYEEGDRRLTEKIAILKKYPGIKFSDFGTRRHFSYKWQAHVLERLMTECPENFGGTSNVALSRLNDTDPIGTFAHEMPMIYAGIADARGESVRDSHNAFLRDWRTRYGGTLSVALTDTFGSEFFLEDFTDEQAEEWDSLRHDSDDPFDFGERVIAFYEESGIDPLDKTIVFSDSLDVATIVKLHERFAGRIGHVFGWGTNLMNDLGLKPLNIVMKATHVKLQDGTEADLVKLSDDAGKHCGPEDLIMRYMKEFAVRRRAQEGILTR
jgi:nicotinate phosphoribosyltransferase